MISFSKCVFFWCQPDFYQQVEQAIADFRTTLHLAIHNNDVFFEKMVNCYRVLMLLKINGTLLALLGVISLNIRCS